jgi:hypothetical protein
MRDSALQEKFGKNTDRDTIVRLEKIIAELEVQNVRLRQEIAQLKERCQETESYT